MQLPSANCLHNSTSSLSLDPLGANGLELDELIVLTVVRELRDVLQDVTPGLDVRDKGTSLLGGSIL